MNVSIKGEKFIVAVEGSLELCSEIAKTTFCFVGVTDWKEKDFIDKTIVPVIPVVPTIKRGRPPKNRNIQEKHCNRCNETKPISEFSRNGKSFQNYCKSCRRDIYRKSKEEENKELVELDPAGAHEWTVEEEDLLRDNYFKNVDLTTVITTHSFAEIKKKARELGMTL